MNSRKLKALRTADMADPDELLAAMAVRLYADRRIDYREALSLSGMTSDRLNRELVRRGLSLTVYPPDSQSSAAA